MKLDTMSKELETFLTEKLLLSAIAAVAERDVAIYVAGPLATGIEYYSRIASGELNPDVRHQNQVMMRSAVNDLRMQGYSVLDPSTITIPNWNPRRVGDFYIEAIRLFAKELRFMNGWEYSSGATKEYLFAVKFGKPTLDLDGNQISQCAAAQLVRNAATELDSMGIGEHKLHSRSFDIENALYDPASKIF